MLSKEELAKIKFISLHQHTHYSLLDGVGTIKDHVTEALKKGHQGFCVSDHGVMTGCIQLYKVAKDKDFLKKLGRTEKVPIVMGSELYISNDLAERSPENKYNHITILVKNDVGYRNLCYLTSIASLPDHFYVRPRISLEELFKHKEGLIVTSGCFIGMIPQAINKGTGQECSLIKQFKDNFGEDFYIELHITSIRKKWDKTIKQHVDQGFDPLEKVNLRLLELAKEYDVKTIIAQDSHMPKKEHHFIQSIMIWNSPSGKDGWHFPEAYYTMSVAEMYEKKNKVTPYLAEAVNDNKFVEFCQNSSDILDKCKDLHLEFEPLLPTIDYENHPVNKSGELESKLKELEDKYREVDPEFSQLIKISEDDIALRTAFKAIIQNNKVDITKDDYRSRLTFEIKTMQRNGVVKLIDYFMLLEDVTRYVRDNGHFRGFGRGSGAGSLLAYCLDITDVDPLRWGLLFERFLTKERIGFMDFSIAEVPSK